MATIVPYRLERHSAGACAVHGCPPCLLQVEGAGGLDGTGAEQRTGAATAVRHRFERHGARGAARGPTIDTSEIVERLVEIVRASAGRHRLLHGAFPLELSD